MNAMAVNRRTFLRGILLGMTSLGTAHLVAACTSAPAITPTSGATATTAAAPTTAASKPVAATGTPAVAGKPTVAASQAPKPSGQVTVTVGSFYAFHQISGWDGLIKAFQSDHPNITIAPQATPAAQYVPKIVAQVASGTAPDVVGAAHVNMFYQFIQNKVLEDLSPYMAAATAAKFTPKDFFPHLINRFTVYGKIYGIPYDCSPLAAMFYTPKQLEESGLKAPPEKWTWTDALKIGVKLTKRNGNQITQYGVDSLQGILPLIYAFGGSLVDDVANPTRCTLDDPRAIEGAQFYLDLIYTHKVAPSPTDVEAAGATRTDMYTTGKISMTLAQFGAPVLTPEPYIALGTRLQIGPTGPDGSGKYGTGGTAYCLTSASKQKDAAWTFLTYFLGEVGHRAAFEAGKVPGAAFPPAHLPSFEWRETKPHFLGDNYYSAIRATVPKVVFAPAGVHWPEVDAKIVSPGLDAVVRQKQPVSYLKEIAAEATKMLQDLIAKSS